MGKIGKSKRPHKHCEVYLTRRTRIKNKIRRLEKKLNILSNARKDNFINPNTKQEPKRKSIENIIKSCRIGRIKEGFTKEDFKSKNVYKRE